MASSGVSSERSLGYWRAYAGRVELLRRGGGGGGGGAFIVCVIVGAGLGTMVRMDFT